MSVILIQSALLKQKMKKIFVPTAVSLLLSACSGTSFFENPVTNTIKDEAYSNSEYYINKADQTSKKEDKQTYRLLAIRKLIDENKAVEAQNTMADLQPAEFNDLQKIEYQLLSAQLSALQENNAQGLEQLRVLPLVQLSPSQQLRYYQTKARIAENQKDVIEAVRNKVQMDTLLKDNQARQENNDQIWALLRDANRGMLEKTTPKAGEVGLAGWLALISIYNHNVSSPSQMPQAINQWKQQYPNHSAAILMPTELQGVSNFQQTSLNSVALLVPLSGDTKVLGEMIKKGFDDAKGDDTTMVQTFDTDTAPVADLVAQAKQQGAQTVVGPLLKPRVDELLSSSEINNINVLALNSTPNVKAVAQVCYYGLTPETEAHGAAERLYQDGIKNAIVAAPQNDFGQRTADAFAKRWLQLSGNDADVRYYNQPTEIVGALQTNGVANNSGLYMLGTAEQVLAIKQDVDNSPLANKMPIYTSSRSNSPNNGPDFRQSMEGVKFSEIPLLSDPDSDMYKKADNLASSDFSMMRLYAMGSDAWALANKFNEFRQIPGYKVSGLTGVLTAGKNCNIERSMTWLEYHNGAVENAR